MPTKNIVILSVTTSQSANSSAKTKQSLCPKQDLLVSLPLGGTESLSLFLPHLIAKKLYDKIYVIYIEVLQKTRNQVLLEKMYFHQNRF